MNSYDVVVLGGGLAGLTLARQLSLERPGTRIFLAEASSASPREAAHKIGESSVEIAGRWFHDVLKLDVHLEKEHLPKLGLRFFLPRGDNSEIAQRLEFGPLRNKVPTPFEGLLLPSYQLDRGRLEKHLAENLPADCELQVGARVVDVELGDGDADHRVILDVDGERRTVEGRWVIDAAGRPGILKKKLELALPTRIHINSVWFRLDTRIKVDDWSDDPDWKGRIGDPIRWHSTVHLLGKGYWCWIIPLAGGQTSVGVVADPRFHAFTEFHRFPVMMDWLDRHEPQLGAAVRAAADKQLDFLALTDYAENAATVTGGDARWGITGDAGLFADPFYSPGSDFVCAVNSMHIDLIRRQLDGEEIGARSERANYYLKIIYDQFIEVYREAYPVMGDVEAMPAKIAFDNAFYWGWVALLAMNGRLTDPDFLDPIHDEIMRSVSLMCRMQPFFTEWAARDDAPPAVLESIDLFDVKLLWSVYTVLVRPIDGDVLRKRLSQNLDRLELLAEAIFRKALAGDPEVEAAVGIDVHKIGWDRSKWEADGLLQGPDRRQALRAEAPGLAALWATEPTADAASRGAQA